MTPLDTGPNRDTELVDQALDWVQSTFARTVALKLTPVLLPVLGGASFWLQDAVGIDMDPAVAAAFVIAVVVGAAGVVLTYVRNHGRGAAEVLQMAIAQTISLSHTGQAEIDEATGTTYSGGDLPTIPPGIR